MDSKIYRLLKYTAIALTLLWLGWSIYDSFLREREPGMHEYAAANRMFDDGEYEQALAQFEAALRTNPQNVFMLRGRARTLILLDRFTDALEEFDEAIARDPQFAPAYANRGTIHDRLGHYELALADYEQALQLDQELAEGPHWLTRLLHNQPESPPTIADRARYLREQLAKPTAERLLRIPEVDDQQRPYKK